MKLAPGDITNVVIGTAGHVDHGKTRLVEALTGINTDRWEEERERGITIDIGFASRELPDGRRVGFIDVPGHERFVRHMIAGATAVDVVLLVVAADDGVMPQTREHLDIAGLLGARDGVVAVTKIDLDRELAEIAAEEVRAFLEGSFLEGAPVVPVSSVTGEGIQELWQALVERVLGHVREVRPEPSSGLFRMPVQRAFTLQGFGTVLTGVPVSGAARVGDFVDILPAAPGSEGRGRIRHIQAYFRDAEVARAGHSAGLNVAGVAVGECRRGQVVVPRDTYVPGVLVDARLRVLPAAGRPLVTGDEVRFHSGTAEVAAKVVVLEGDHVEPGADALVQFRLAQPLVFDRLDRYIVRWPSPALTLGGGTITGPGRRRLRGGRPWIAERVREREVASGSDESFIEHLVETASGGSIRADVLRHEALLPAERTGGIVESLLSQRRIRSYPPGPSYVHEKTVGRLSGLLSGLLGDLHEREPDLPGLDVNRAAAELHIERPLLESVVAGGTEAGTLVRDGEYVRLASHEPSLGEEDAPLARDVEAAYRDAGYSPPAVGEIARRLGAKEQRVQRVCEFLAHAGTVVRASPGMFFHSEHVGSARRFVLAELREKGLLETQALKAFMTSSGGTSRKYLVPLLEHFDRIGLTRREGDLRRAGEGASLESARGE